jgi:hypothetical protein
MGSFSSFPSILASNFAAVYPAFSLILILLHSSLTMYRGVSLSTTTTLLKYFFSTSSCFYHLYTLYPALKHHYSAPEVTFPLSPIP